MYAKCKGMLDTYRMFNNTLLPCGHSNNKVEHSKCKAIEIEQQVGSKEDMAKPTSNLSTMAIQIHEMYDIGFVCRQALRQVCSCVQQCMWFVGKKI